VLEQAGFTSAQIELLRTKGAFAA
ncbi:MAG: hypothetical protein RLY18_1513, partial [Pseudomonadota bacterium]